MNKTTENFSAGEAVETVSAESKTENKTDLIAYLKDLERRQDRAALAHLRRGLGRPPKTAMEMYPYLGRFLSNETKHSYETAVFIVAALFAYYPDAPSNVGNLGASLQRLKDSSDSIEKRFVALLNASIEDLPYYLRQIVGLLKSNEIAVNWEQLFKDLQHWEISGENSKYESVQSRWARSFWGSHANRENNQDSQSNSGGTNQ